MGRACEVDTKEDWFGEVKGPDESQHGGYEKGVHTSFKM